MKKLVYLSAIAIIAACGKPKDKKAELEQLRKQRSELDAKIAKLETETGGKTPQRVAEVGVLTIAPSTFTSYIEIQGTVDADENVMANAQAPGVLTSIKVVPGQRVSKGQVLATLDNSALQQQILQAQTALSVANTLYKRQKNLWDQKIGTEVQYIQAKSNRDMAERQLAALRAQAGMYTIKAPISGTVDQMDLKLGQAIQPGMQGIRIVNLDRLKVKTNVPETYSTQLSRGNSVIVNVPDANQTIKANLSYVSKVIDPASRSFNVEVRLPARSSVKPNMTAVLQIIDENKNDAIVLPIKAIQKSELGSYVYVNQNNKAKRVNITPGTTYKGQTNILSGLKPGDQVIVDGAQNIEEGDSVHAQAI